MTASVAAMVTTKPSADRANGGRIASPVASRSATGVEPAHPVSQPRVAASSGREAAVDRRSARVTDPLPVSIATIRVRVPSKAAQTSAAVGERAAHARRVEERSPRVDALSVAEAPDPRVAEGLRQERREGTEREPAGRSEGIALVDDQRRGAVRGRAVHPAAAFRRGVPAWFAPSRRRRPCRSRERAGPPRRARARSTDSPRGFVARSCPSADPESAHARRRAERSSKLTSRTSAAVVVHHEDAARGRSPANVKSAASTCR